MAAANARTCHWSARIHPFCRGCPATWIRTRSFASGRIGLVDGGEGPSRVEPPLGEPGANERRALVQRDEVAENVARREHLVLDLLRLLNARHRARHERIRGHAAAALHLHQTHESTRDGVDLIVVHPGEPIDGLGRPVDRRQNVRREDGSGPCLDHHRQDVRFAERLVETIVHRHEGMPLREQVAGPELELQPCGEHRKGERDRENGAHDQSAMAHEPGPEARHRVLVASAERDSQQ